METHLKFGLQPTTPSLRRLGGKKLEKSTVAFVNEYISEEDFKAYGLEEIDKKFVVGRVRSPQWTINRDANIYLRCVARGREERGHRSTWVFFWRGEMLKVYLENLDMKGQPGGPRQGHKRVRRIEMPAYLEERQEEILGDLREALVAYKDGGVFATATSYTLTLDI